MRLRKRARLPVFPRELPSPCAALILLFLVPLEGRGQDSLVDLPSFRAGCQALEDLRFSSAAASFRKTWDEIEAADVGDLEKDFVAARLIESLVRNGESREAVNWLRAHPIASPSPATTRWRALSLQAEGRFSEAALAYGSLLNTFAAPPRDLVLAQATCLAQSGRPEAALELIDGKFDPRSEREILQFAAINSQAGKPDKALELLSREIAETDQGESLPLARLRLTVTVLKQLGQPEEAVAKILEAIDGTADESSALQAFLLLEAAGAAADSETLQRSLSDWVANSEHPASSSARFFSPLLLEPDRDPTEHLISMRESETSPRLRSEATIRLLSDDALEATPGSSPPSLDSDALPGGEIRLAFEEAALAFRRDRFDEAALRFARLADLQIGENRSRDLYNSAIAFLRSGNREQFDECRELLRRENPRSPLLGNLDYAGGLTLAAEANAEAAEVLKQFSQEYPGHPLQIDALLALAEFYLNQAPARPQAAREIFERLQVRPLTLEQSERFDYGKLWLERIEGNPSNFVPAAEKFLTDWPNSTYRPEVAMLLARENYESRRFEKARVLFHLVATEHPESSFAEIARFFEIKATSDPLEAEGGWKMLLSKGTPFPHQARHELGLLHLAEGRFDEARVEFQAVADSVEPRSSLRYAALGDIGFSYYREAIESDDPAPLLENASAAFARLAQTADAPEEWIYNASVRRGKCLEMLGRPSVALEIYQSIVVNRSNEKGSLAPTKPSPEASIWVFRAGFAAIDILSEEKDWRGAIRVADYLSEEDGARALKASRLAERMRLEHWIWD